MVGFLALLTRIKSDNDTDQSGSLGGGGEVVPASSPWLLVTACDGEQPKSGKRSLLTMADAPRAEQPSDPLLIRVVIRFYPCQQSEEAHHARAGTDGNDLHLQIVRRTLPRQPSSYLLLIHPHDST
ncbi:MAG TPA: hypothetical protein VF118_16895, partial [Gemmatimonadaceae bacterium]